MPDFSAQFWGLFQDEKLNHKLVYYGHQLYDLDHGDVGLGLWVGLL